MHFHKTEFPMFNRLGVFIVKKYEKESTLYMGKGREKFLRTGLLLVNNAGIFFS